MCIITEGAAARLLLGLGREGHAHLGRDDLADAVGLGDWSDTLWKTRRGVGFGRTAKSSSSTWPRDTDWWQRDREEGREGDKRENRALTAM